MVGDRMMLCCTHRPSLICMSVLWLENKFICFSFSFHFYFFSICVFALTAFNSIPLMYNNSIPILASIPNGGLGLGGAVPIVWMLIEPVNLNSLALSSSYFKTRLYTLTALFAPRQSTAFETAPAHWLLLRKFKCIFSARKKNRWNKEKFALSGLSSEYLLHFGCRWNDVWT